MNSRRVSELMIGFLNCSYRLTADTSLSTNQERLCPKIGSTILMPKERRDRPIRSRLGPHMMASGLEDSETVLVFKSGQMVPNMRDSGKTIELMARENLRTSMVTFMMESGSTIKLMDMVSITISMVLNMKASGEMIFSTVRAKKAGLMAPYTTVTTWPVRNTEWASTAGTMAQNMTVSGMRTRSRVLEHIAGSMEGNTRASG